MAESALAGGLDPGNSADRFQVTVHVQTGTLPSREAADEARRVSAETRTGSPAPSEPPTTAADAAPHVAAETWETRPAESVPIGPAGNGAHPDGNTMPGVASEAGRSLGYTRSRDSRSERPAIVALDADLDAGQAVIEQLGGLHVGREAARRVACDAGLVVLQHGAGGEVLDVGRRTRTVPSALRRALLSRDRGQCQFPGCDSRHCDAHHVEHWADGGETRLTNLVSLCRFHHRAVHEQGFRVVPGDAEGQFLFLRPDGEPLPAEPPAVCWGGAPLAPTDARLAAAGIRIGPHTATPDWYGETLDLQAVLDVLWEPPGGVAHGGP